MTRPSEIVAIRRHIAKSFKALKGETASPIEPRMVGESLNEATLYLWSGRVYRITIERVVFPEGG